MRIHLYSFLKITFAFVFKSTYTYAVSAAFQYKFVSLLLPSGLEEILLLVPQFSCALCHNQVKYGKGIASEQLHITSFPTLFWGVSCSLWDNSVLLWQYLYTSTPRKCLLYFCSMKNTPLFTKLPLYCPF